MLHAEWSITLTVLTVKIYLPLSDKIIIYLQNGEPHTSTQFPQQVEKSPSQVQTPLAKHICFIPFLLLHEDVTSTLLRRVKG